MIMKINIHPELLYVAVCDDSFSQQNLKVHDYGVHRMFATGTKFGNCWFSKHFAVHRKVRSWCLVEVVKKALWGEWRLDCDLLFYRSAITVSQTTPRSWLYNVMNIASCPLLGVRWWELAQQGSLKHLWSLGQSGRFGWSWSGSLPNLGPLLHFSVSSRPMGCVLTGSWWGQRK